MDLCEHEHWNNAEQDALHENCFGAADWRRFLAHLGTTTIGYVPDGKIVGLSKLTRLVECFARRLPVQERLTVQIAEALMTHLQSRSVGIVLKCRHMCMESRGIQAVGEETVTSVMPGEIRNVPAQRQEFLP